MNSGCPSLTRVLNNLELWSAGSITGFDLKESKLKPTINLRKAATGISGFDDVTNGGLPAGRATVIEGGPGSGKTLMALQTLVHGARACDEPGVFVTFEERAERIISNAASFGWDLPGLQRKKLFFLDAQPEPDLVLAGSFELSGMLAALDAKVRTLGAKRIVFDSLDMVLSLLPDHQAERRELLRLHDWLLRRDLTALVTVKRPSRGNGASNRVLDFMQFMVDCVVGLHHRLDCGVSQRGLRVLKYRGSSFMENEAPLVIGPDGLEVGGPPVGSDKFAPVSRERVSSGVTRLDTMLNGGYHRGAGVLITGAPGTAKSTLCGTFLEAACERGESSLMVSFDSPAAEIVRNLSSVGIRLRRFLNRGTLRIVSSRSVACNAENHLLRIKRLCHEGKVRNLVVDPVSALAKQGNESTAHGVVERLVDWTKAEGITLLCTSLLSGHTPEEESTPLQISTIADTWIHLSYLVTAGERNRALSIVKSRGTAHSNQVRELVLARSGVDLADVYTAGGEVLMGTLRWEKEEAARKERSRLDAERLERRREAEHRERDLEDKISALQRDLSDLRKETRAADREVESREDDGRRRRAKVGKLRHEDSATDEETRDDSAE